MSPEELRETIVQAAIPFIAEWDAATTEQIAHAAGIDEATLLGVFNDKEAAFLAAIQALVLRALDPTQVVRELHAIPLDQPLAARLVEATDALDTYHDRIGTLLAPVDSAGVRHRTPTPNRDTAGQPHTRRSNQENLRAVARLDVICEAVTKLLEPDQQHLRLSAGTLADAFLGLYSGRKRTAHPDPSRLPAEQLVDLFMHGALTSSNTQPRSGS